MTRSPFFFWRGTAFLFLFLALSGWKATAQAKSIEQDTLGLHITVSHPYIKPQAHQKVYLKIGIKGSILQNKNKRAPLNLAVVLDRSGSMGGERIERAKQAAKMIIEMLQPNDIFSLVTYDSSVQVLVSATKVSDKHEILRRIDSIRAGGFTALFGGVSKGLAEVRKFLSKERVNRVILLSDGLANVGPSSPNALGRLGEASAKEGIAITTVGLGLGYNEDLMTQLARRSDGNHGFAKNSQDLARIFRAELGDITAVVAQKVRLKILCAPGVRPIRVLDRPAEIRDNLVYVSFNQLYSGQEKYLLLEIEPPVGDLRSQQSLASVEARFLDMQKNLEKTLKAKSDLRYSLDDRTIQQHLRRHVLIEVYEAIGNETNRRAVSLRDKGQLEAARHLLLHNAATLKKMAEKLKSPRLLKFSTMNSMDSKNLRGHSWRYRRKLMRKRQYKIQNQTNW
ncbi:MAG: VWA domain-containing protein [Myxococcales bacterium]|nr:VWA domain-containing protein [Myxococcales bacterium]